MSDIEQISKQVEADRARLAGTLDALGERVRPKAVAQDVTAAMNEVGGDLAQKAWSKLRDNPAGGLLVSLGLGLLATSGRSHPTEADAKTALVPTDEAYTGFDARVAQADAAIREDMTGTLEDGPDAGRLRETLNQGLDMLPPAARKRVIDARRAAIKAQEKVDHQVRRSAAKSKSFVQQQPLVAGALAIGFGVLAGTLLPGTRREDELVGKHRDEMMAQARATLEAEMVKARAEAEEKIADAAGTTRQALHQ